MFRLIHDMFTSDWIHRVRLVKKNVRNCGTRYTSNHDHDSSGGKGEGRLLWRNGELYSENCKLRRRLSTALLGAWKCERQEGRKKGPMTLTKVEEAAGRQQKLHRRVERREDEGEEDDGCNEKRERRDQGKSPGREKLGAMARLVEHYLSPCLLPSVLSRCHP